jgi:predicted PurR-regulated permease PerM
MTSKELSNGILRTIAILSGIVLLGFLFYKLSSLLAYLIVSVLFTLLANPVVVFLKKRLKFKNTLAVVTTLVLFVLLVVGLTSLFVPLIISQGENLSLLDMKKMEENYNEIMTSIDNFLQEHGYNFSDFMKTTKFNLNFIPNFLNTLISFVGNFGIGLASVLFISFFFLNEKMSFVKRFKELIPDQHEGKILNSIRKIIELLSRYFGGLMLQLIIILILYLIIFLIFGVENALVIALLCAILNIIPYLGPILALIVASSLILLSGIGDDNFLINVLPTVLYVVIGMSVVQVIDNNLSQPLIFSKSTKSHPLEIFLVILAAGTLFGIIGMIFAVPTYTSLKVIAKEFFPENKIIKTLTKDI